jgi:urate oxidase
MSFTWDYKDGLESIDYDGIWNKARETVLKNWAGDIIAGAYKSSTQFSAQEAQRSILEAIPEIKSVNMNLPNLLYVNFDFSRFPEHLVKKNENRQILMPSLPSAFGFSRMIRK